MNYNEKMASILVASKMATDEQVQQQVLPQEVLPQEVYLQLLQCMESKGYTPDTMALDAG